MSASNGRDREPSPLVLTKSSAVQISAVSLLIGLAQAVAITAGLMAVRYNDQAAVVKLESEMSGVRANQAVFGQLAEKIEVGTRALELLRQRIDYLSIELNNQNARYQEFARSVAKINEETLRNSLMIQSIMSPSPQRENPKALFNKRD